MAVQCSKVYCQVIKSKLLCKIEFICVIGGQKIPFSLPTLVYSKETILHKNIFVKTDTVHNLSKTRVSFYEPVCVPTLNKHLL